MPEAGDYEPYVKDEPRDIVAFEKMLGRNQEKVDEDDDMEGDVLILNPAKIGKHLP